MATKKTTPPDQPSIPGTVPGSLSPEGVDGLMGGPRKVDAAELYGLPGSTLPSPEAYRRMSQADVLKALAERGISHPESFVVEDREGDARIVQAKTVAEAKGRLHAEEVAKQQQMLNPKVTYATTADPLHVEAFEVLTKLKAAVLHWLTEWDADAVVSLLAKLKAAVEAKESPDGE